MLIKTDSWGKRALDAQHMLIKTDSWGKRALIKGLSSFINTQVSMRDDHLAAMDRYKTVARYREMSEAATAAMNTNDDVVIACDFRDGLVARIDETANIAIDIPSEAVDNVIQALETLADVLKESTSLPCIDSDERPFRLKEQVNLLTASEHILGQMEAIKSVLNLVY